MHRRPLFFPSALSKLLPIVLLFFVLSEHDVTDAVAIPQQLSANAPRSDALTQSRSDNRRNDKEVLFVQTDTPASEKPANTTTSEPVPSSAWITPSPDSSTPSENLLEPLSFSLARYTSSVASYFKALRLQAITTMFGLYGRYLKPSLHRTERREQDSILRLFEDVVMVNNTPINPSDHGSTITLKNSIFTPHSSRSENNSNANSASKHTNTLLNETKPLEHVRIRPGAFPSHQDGEREEADEYTASANEDHIQRLQPQFGHHQVNHESTTSVETSTTGMNTEISFQNDVERPAGNTFVNDFKTNVGTSSPGDISHSPTSPERLHQLDGTDHIDSPSSPSFEASREGVHNELGGNRNDSEPFVEKARSYPSVRNVDMNEAGDVGTGVDHSHFSPGSLKAVNGDGDSFNGPSSDGSGNFGHGQGEIVAEGSYGNNNENVEGNRQIIPPTQGGNGIVSRETTVNGHSGEYVAQSSTRDIVPSEPSTTEEADSGSERGGKFMGVRNVEKGSGENITQLSLMVYKIAKTEGVTSLAVAPCREVMHWMPTVAKRLEAEVAGFEFFCIDITDEPEAMSDLRQAYGDLSGAYIQSSADEIGERFPRGVDLVVSWMGIQKWGIRKSWRFIKGLRRSGARLCLLGNNSVRNNADVDSGIVNVRKSPMLFNEPMRVINKVGDDADKQLLLYAMDKIRDDF